MTVYGKMAISTSNFQQLFLVKRGGQVAYKTWHSFFFEHQPSRTEDTNLPNLISSKFKLLLYHGRSGMVSTDCQQQAVASHRLGKFFYPIRKIL